MSSFPRRRESIFQPSGRTAVIWVKLQVLIELREETGLVAGRVQFVGSMFIAYGLCTQRCNVFLATDLQQAEQQLDAEEAGLVCRAFALEGFERILREGMIQDGTTWAVVGMLKTKGLL